jgi:hypothetical protein
MKILNQIIGTILIFIGGFAAVIFGLLFFFLFARVGLYGSGIIAAVIYVLPAFLLSLAVKALGRFIKDRANKMTHGDDPVPYPPANLINHPISKQPSPKKELS